MYYYCSYEFQKEQNRILFAIYTTTSTSYKVAMAMAMCFCSNYYVTLLTVTEDLSFCNKLCKFAKGKIAYTHSILCELMCKEEAEENATTCESRRKPD